jgi:hypothetical protein
LGAALSFLADEATDKALQQVDLIKKTSNVYEQYLVATVRLHIAAMNDDAKERARLLDVLQEARRQEPLFDKAANAIERGDFRGATKLYVAILLRAA